MSISCRECPENKALAQHFLPAQSLGMLVDDQSSPEQIVAFCRMSPARRLTLAEQLYWSARELKAAGLRAQHADWTQQQVAREVTRIFAHART